MEGNEIRIGDRVSFYGFAGLDGRGEVVSFTGFGLFAYVKTRWAVSGDEFVARVPVANMTKDGAT